MVMAAAALLSKNNRPTDSEINAAMPNICRCGTYPRVRRAIHRAGRVIRREERITAAPPPGITPEDAAAAVPAIVNPDAANEKSQNDGKKSE